MSDHVVDIIGKPAGWYSEWFACCQTCDWRGPVNGTQWECREDASPHDGVSPNYPREIVYTDFPVGDLHRYSNDKIRGALALEETRMQERMDAVMDRLER